MRVLFVAHGFPPAATGGTELYTHAVAGAVATVPGHSVSVLTRESDPGRPEYDVRLSADGPVQIAWVNNTFRACSSFDDTYANPALLRSVDRVIDSFAPDVAHIQHLTCLSAGLPGLLSRRSVRVVMTLNDYWMICHRGQLLNVRGERCAGPFPDGCGDCVPSTAAAGERAYRLGRGLLAVPGVEAVTRGLLRVADAHAKAPGRALTAVRLEAMRRAASHVDLFLAPSSTLFARFREFGIPAERLVRCEQGIALPLGPAAERSGGGVLRVGFAGTLLPSKAPHVLLEAASLLPPERISVDVAGTHASYHGDDSYARVLAPLLRQPFVRHAGPIAHRDMFAWLGGIDVLVVPSVWIENAPFVIREAFAARVPVVASRLGGMAEMVRDGVDGLLFEPGDARSLAAALQRFLDQPDLLAALRAGIREPMSIQEDARALTQMYGKLIESGPAEAGHYGTAEAATKVHTVAVVLNYCTAAQTWLAVRSLQTSFDPPAGIVVVDNASPDGSSQRLRKSLSGVDLIVSPANRGFSAGCNLGIRRALEAGADAVLLVNSDVVVAPELPQTLAQGLASDPHIGIAGPVVVSREEPDWVASAGIAYNRTTGRMRHLMTGADARLVVPGAVRDVDGVSGCAMLVRREVFDAAGLFDEDYFFSFEDLELCLRAAARGYRTVCVHDARAYHEGGRTIGRRSPRRVYFATRNHLKLASGVDPASAIVRAARASGIVGLNAAYVLTSADAPLVGGLAAVARGVWHHVIGRYGAD